MHARIQYNRHPLHNTYGCTGHLQGIAYLIEQELLEEDCQEVAKFLYSDGLNKTAIGDYLGEK